MDTEKVALGGLLIAVSYVVLVEAGIVVARTPIAAVDLSTIGLSVGSLLADTARTERT